MEKLTPIESAILSALIKNSKISDRQLGKQLGVSQPTVTRRRARLEKENLLDYTATPNFAKLGFEIMALTFITSKRQVTEESVRRAKSFFDKRNDVIFASTGSGMGRNRVNISLHKSYSDYVEYVRALEKDWSDTMESRTVSFIVSLKSDNIIRGLTFKHIADYIKTNSPI